MKDPILKQAMGEWERLSEDPDARIAYIARRKQILDEMAAVKEAEKRERQAKEEGRVEEKLEIAKKMLEEGLSVEFIHKFTGLPLEEIEKLRSSSH